MVIIISRLRTGQPRNCVSIYSQDKTIFCFQDPKQALQPNQPFSGHLYPSPRVKWFGHISDHPHPSSATVKNRWSYTSNPHSLSQCA